MAQPKTAAGQIWPDLAQGTPSEVEQRRSPNLADALYPRPKPSPDEQWWRAWRERERQSLLRHLREANASLRADKVRGRR